MQQQKMLRIVPPGQRHSQPAAAVHRLRQPDDGFLLELQKAPGKRVHPGIAHRRKNIVVRGCQEQCGHVGIEIGDTFQGVDGVIALDILRPELPNKRFLPRKRRAACAGPFGRARCAACDIGCGIDRGGICCKCMIYLYSLLDLCWHSLLN